MVSWQVFMNILVCLGIFACLFFEPVLDTLQFINQIKNYLQLSEPQMYASFQKE